MSDQPPTTPTTKSRFERAQSSMDARQLAIIRQHSQSMSLKVLKLKQALGELSVEDLKPSKLRQLADFFDTDVKEAANAT